MFELDELANNNTPPKENLMIVDCLNLAFRYKHRGQTDFAGDYLRTIDSLAKSYGARTVILLADKGKSSYRLELHPGYKGDRAEKYKDQTEEEKQKVLEFFEGYDRALELAATRYPLLQVKGVEADDTAAYIVSEHAKEYKHVWLISSDKDWDLLLNDKVSRFSFVTRREYTMDNFYDEHGCDDPEEYVSVKALMGDPGDSIDGIPNVGVKRAYNLIKEFGSAFDLVDALPLPGNLKTIQSINNSGDLILRNIELVDLLSYCSTAIDHAGVLDLVEQFCKDNLYVKN